jgi:ATP phosphoribosyltransferase regulatory subunit
MPDAVILDLGLIGRHNYYTGAVFEVYAAGLGFTVANGGRYDNLLKRFGQDPAGHRLRHLPRKAPLRATRRRRFPAPRARRGRRRRHKAAVALRASAYRLCTSRGPEPDAAAKYAASVEADWICYPTA